MTNFPERRGFARDPADELPDDGSWSAEVPLPRKDGFVARLVRTIEKPIAAVLARLDRLDSPLLNPWLKLVRDREFWRFVRFLAVGSLNFLFYYTLFTGLHFLDVPPTQAVVLATVVAVLFNFCTTGRMVFGSGRIRLLPRFVAVYVVQCILNIGMLSALMRMGVPVLLAELLVIGVLAVATFFALRRFVFHDRLKAAATTL